MYISTIASVISIAAGANSLMNSGGGSAGGGYGSGVPYYVPKDQAGADQAWQDAMAQQQQYTNAIPGQTAGIYQNELSNLSNMNYSPLAQGGAMAGEMAGQGAQGLMQNAGAIQQQAFDPQNALYNRTQQQLTDQINAQQGLRGLGTSGVVGSELNQALSNFNIDWQNQQLQRMLQGNQGMAADYSAAPQLAVASGQLPVQGQQAMYQAPGAAAQNYTSQIAGMLQPGQQMQNQNLGYLNYGTGNASNAYGSFANQQGFGAQQGAAGMQSTLTGLQGLYNSGIFGGNASDPSLSGATAGAGTYGSGGGTAPLWG